MKIRATIWSVLFLSALSMGATAQPGKRATSLQMSGLYRAFPAVAQFGAATGEAYVFSAGGDVYRGWTATQSVQPFDFARARRNQPQKTGKYTVSRDKITFRWSDGSSETASFSLRRDAKTGRTTLTLGPSYAYKIVAHNNLLEGSFAPNTYQGGFGDESQRIVDTISFTRGGNFQVKEGARTLLQGRYKISGAALTLLLADGQKRTHSLHVFEDRNGPPQTILLDGRPFAKK